MLGQKLENFFRWFFGKLKKNTISFWNFLIFKEVEDGTKEEVITVEMATQEKDKGTKFFRMNQLQEACETYTNYINMCHRIEDHADLFKSKMIYQGYANR